MLSLVEYEKTFITAGPEVLAIEYDRANIFPIYIIHMPYIL